MKKLLLSITLLLSIPAAHAMGPAAYESGAAESSAVAVEMIPVRQAIDRINTRLTNPQITELTRRLQLCADEYDLIAPEIAHTIAQQLLNESATATLSLGEDDDSSTLLNSSSDNTTTSLPVMPVRTTIRATPYAHTIATTEKKVVSDEDEKEGANVRTMPSPRKLGSEDYWEIKKLDLRYECTMGRYDKLKTLLEQNIPHNIINEVFVDNILSNDLPIIKLLLQHGANPNAVNKDGCNLLQNLLKHMYDHETISEIIILLITAGSRVDHKNHNGHTALDLAANYGTHDALYAEENGYTLHRTINHYHHIKSLILQTLCELQAIRQQAEQTLRDAQLPDVLTNLIYEYATLPDRDREITFVNQHWQHIKWKSKLDNFRHSRSLIRGSMNEMLGAHNRPALYSTTITVAILATLIGYAATTNPTTAIATGTASACAAGIIYLLMPLWFDYIFPNGFHRYE